MAFSDKWTPEQDAKLKECVDRKMSARLAGSYLGVTHNAAIGRANRLGWKFDSFGLGGQQRFRPHAPVNGMKRPKRSKTTRAPDFSFRKSTVTAEQPASKPNMAEPEFLGLALLELGPHDCRYPKGGDQIGEPVFFCGQPALEDQSWCSYHAKVCFSPSSQRTFSTFKTFR